MWLTRFVEDVHLLLLEPGAAQQVDRLPDGRTSLVIRQRGPGDGDAFVFGPRTRALLKDAHGFSRAVMVVLKPGWSSPLLGVAADALTDRIVSLDDLWGAPGRALAESLAGAASMHEVLATLSETLAHRTRDAAEPASAALARRAVRLCEREVRVDRLAAQLGVSARHLRRAFLESVGVGPKEYLRGVRLRRALARTAVVEDWGRIATDAGYYDQAHLIAEFRDLVGLTPRAYLARARAAAHAA